MDKADLSWRREIEYPLLGRVRGRFHTGPLMVRTTDPFGLVRLDRQFVATTEVMVTPRVEPLPVMRTAGGAGSTGEARPHRIGVVGQDDALVREYRQGDDVRRIHWRSTARWGDLMVRREEQAWDPSASVILDSRASAHAGRGMHSSIEWAISAAASIGCTSWTTASASRSTKQTARCTSPAPWASTARPPRELVISRLTDLRPGPTTTMHYAVESADDRPARASWWWRSWAGCPPTTRARCSGCAATGPRVWRW